MKAGDLVVFKSQSYWIYEVVDEKNVIIIPMADWDFLEQAVYLRNAIKVNVKNLTSHGPLND